MFILFSPSNDFVTALSREFQDRLRIRWSLAKHEWHIEQKVGRAALPPFRISDADDRTICARDGYAFVMAIKPGNHTSCPHCGLKCRVPELRSAEIVCTYCESQKHRRGRVFGGYWPLGEALLEHLRKIDPYRDGTRRTVAELNLSEERREWQRKRTIHNHIEAATLDDKYQLFDTPFSGYTGRTFGAPVINGRPY